MKIKLFVTLVLVAAVVFSSAIIANAQTCPPLAAGCLDNTFGNGGTSVTWVPATLNLPSAKGVAQSDGKILSLADAHLNTGISFTNVIIRYNSDGTIDTAFGSGGFVYMNWHGANNSFGNAYAIAIQAVETTPGVTEEKIIVAGATNGSSPAFLRVDRYNSDGSVDASFGTNGRTILNAGYALAVAIQPDGKILTMGDVSVLVRLNADGTLDATFGSNGVSQANSGVKARSLAVQSNGRILAVGGSTASGKNILTVTRFNSNGTLDDGRSLDSTPGDSFGTAGKTTVDFFGAGSGGNDVKIDGSGKIVVAGAALRKGSTPSDFGVARLTANGQLDTTFGVSGKATVDFNNAQDSALNLELQSNGKIVLIGGTNTSSTSTKNFAMARLSPAGVLDSTFGEGGRVVTDFSSEWENVSSGALQRDPVCGCERIVAIGSIKLSSQAYAVAARYIP